MAPNPSDMSSITKDWLREAGSLPEPNPAVDENHALLTEEPKHPMPTPIPAD